MDDKRIENTLKHLAGIGWPEWKQVKRIVDMCFHIQESELKRSFQLADFEKLEDVRKHQL